MLNIIFNYRGKTYRVVISSNRLVHLKLPIWSIITDLQLNWDFQLTMPSIGSKKKAQKQYLIHQTLHIFFFLSDESSNDISNKRVSNKILVGQHCCGRWFMNHLVQTEIAKNLSDTFIINEIKAMENIRRNNCGHHSWCNEFDDSLLRKGQNIESYVELFLWLSNIYCLNICFIINFNHKNNGMMRESTAKIIIKGLHESIFLFLKKTK